MVRTVSPKPPPRLPVPTSSARREAFLSKGMAVWYVRVAPIRGGAGAADIIPGAIRPEVADEADAHPPCQAPWPRGAGPADSAGLAPLRRRLDQHLGEGVRRLVGHGQQQRRVHARRHQRRSRASAPPVSTRVGWPPGRFTTPMSRMEHAAREAGAERLGAGLLGGPALGVGGGAQRLGAALGPRALGLGEARAPGSARRAGRSPARSGGCRTGPSPGR